MLVCRITYLELAFYKPLPSGQNPGVVSSPPLPIGDSGLPNVGQMDALDNGAGPVADNTPAPVAPAIPPVQPKSAPSVTSSGNKFSLAGSPPVAQPAPTAPVGLSGAAPAIPAQDENGVQAPSAYNSPPRQSARHQLTPEQRAAQTAQIAKANDLQTKITGMASQLKSGSVSTGGRGIRKMTTQEYSALHAQYLALKNELSKLQ